MSVEKNGGESATETKVSRQADNLDLPKMEEEVMESKTDQSKVSTYDREVDATDSAGTNDLEAKETEIRQWFKGLSSEELWETLGIEDGKYLETLLTIPSWSRAVPSGEGDERGEYRIPRGAHVAAVLKDHIECPDLRSTADDRLQDVDV